MRTIMRWARRLRPRGTGGRGKDAGIVTSEFAMVTLGACALAAVLHKVVTGGQISAALQSVIGKALGAEF